MRKLMVLGALALCVARVNLWGNPNNGLIMLAPVDWLPVAGELWEPIGGMVLTTPEMAKATSEQECHAAAKKVLGRSPRPRMPVGPEYDL